MRPARLTIPMLLALGFPSLAWADGTVVLAPLIAKGVDEKVAHNVTGLLSSELDFSGSFDGVNELQTMPPTLKEACLASTACLAPIAKGGGGAALVAGTISPSASGGITLSLVYYDVAKNAIVRKKTFDTPKEPSEIATRATSIVKELLTGQSSAAAKAESAPLPTNLTDSEEDGFEFDAKPAPKPTTTTASKATATKTPATAAKTTTPTKAPPPKPAKPLTDEEEEDDLAPVARVSDDGPDYAEPEEEERAAKEKAAAAARVKALAEQEAREAAEEKARVQAEAEAKARAKTEAEARAKAEAEAQARAEAAERARAAAEAKAAADAAAKAKIAADAQAKADAAARAKADAAAKAQAAKPAAASSEFSFGSGSGAIVMDEEEEEEEVTPPPKPAATTTTTTRRNYYETEDSPPADDRYADLDAPATKSTKTTSTSTAKTTTPARVVEEDEELDPAPRSTTSTSRSTKPVVDEEEELDEPVDLDLDEPSTRRTTASTSSTPSRSSSSSNEDTRTSARAEVESDFDRPGVTLTPRGGYARFEDLSFVTYGGELGVPMGKSAALVIGLAGFSTQRHFTPEDIAYIAQTTGQNPADIDPDPWNTILPFNFGVVYKVSGSAIRPYAGGDIVLAPYTAEFDLAVGARIRGGADFMVANNFGFNIDLAAGILSGKEFVGIDSALANTGLLPQVSGGTVFRF